MATQVATKNQKLRGVMASAAFSRGFSEARKGKPIEYEAYTDSNSNDQWNYERGRLLAMIYDGPLKEDRRVTYQAMTACAEAIQRGWLI